MAKGKALTQQDLMIWTLQHPNGTRLHYLIEKEPYETGGFKKTPHRIGMTTDAVFHHREDAEAELARYPSGLEEADAEGAEAATAAE